MGPLAWWLTCLSLQDDAEESEEELDADEDNDEYIVDDDEDSDEEDKLQAKIAEEHEKFRLAQEERQEKSTVRTLPSPMPESQRKREIETQQFALAPPSSSEDRTDYIPPETRPYLPPEESNQTAYTAPPHTTPPRPQSADRVRSSRIPSAGTNHLSDIQEESPLDDALLKSDQSKKKEEEDQTGVPNLDDYVNHIQGLKQKAKAGWGAVKQVSLERDVDKRESFMSRISSGREDGNASGKWVVEGDEVSVDDPPPSPPLPPPQSQSPQSPQPPPSEPEEAATPPSPSPIDILNHMDYFHDPTPVTPATTSSSKKYSSLAESALGGPLPDLTPYLLPKPATIILNDQDQTDKEEAPSSKARKGPPPPSLTPKGKPSPSQQRRPWSASPQIPSASKAAEGLAEKKRRAEEMAIDLLQKDILTSLPPPSAPPPSDPSTGSKKSPQRPSSARPSYARPSSAQQGSRVGVTARPSSARPTSYNHHPLPPPYLQISVDGKVQGSPSSDWPLNSPYYSPRVPLDSKVVYQSPQLPSKSRQRPQSAIAAFRPSRSQQHETVLRQISYDVPTSSSPSPGEVERMAGRRMTAESPQAIEGSTALVKLRGQHVSVYHFETLKKVQEANDSLSSLGRNDVLYKMWDPNRIQLIRYDQKGHEEVVKTITFSQLMSENAKLKQQRGVRGTRSSGGGASAAEPHTGFEEEEDEVCAPLSIQEEYRRRLANISSNCAALADSTRKLRYSQMT